MWWIVAQIAHARVCDEFATAPQLNAKCKAKPQAIHQARVHASERQCSTSVELQSAPLIPDAGQGWKRACRDTPGKLRAPGLIITRVPGKSSETGQCMCVRGRPPGQKPHPHSRPAVRRRARAKRALLIPRRASAGDRRAAPAGKGGRVPSSAGRVFRPGLIKPSASKNIYEPRRSPFRGTDSPRAEGGPPRVARGAPRVASPRRSSGRPLALARGPRRTSRRCRPYQGRRCHHRSRRHCHAARPRCQGHRQRHPCQPLRPRR